MRLSDEQRGDAMEQAQFRATVPGGGGPSFPPVSTNIAKLALDLADELAAMREEAETQFMANADVIRNHEQTRKELAASQRREKRLKRQVELMGWLLDSREKEVAGMSIVGRSMVVATEYDATIIDSAAQDLETVLNEPSFTDMGHLDDYTDDDLDMLKDHWPAAREELERRQMAADWPTGETMQEIDARENPR